MDDLDRLYLELVARLRRERPSSLTESLRVGELHQEVIPYRRVRDAVGFRSNDEYEMALTRLLAGQRSYVLGDSVMQDELSAGLEEALPDIHRYRSHSEARVWLNPATIPPPGDTRYAPPELREQEDWTSMPGDDPGGPAHQPGGTETEPAAGERTEPASESREEESAVTGEAGARVDADQVVVPDTASETFAACPRCGEPPPEGAAFCPFCGGRLTPENCDECGRRLETSWRFCPECGRRREPPERAT